VWADSLAKHELHRIASLTSPPLRCHMLLGERWSAFIASEKIVSDPRIPVLEAIGTNLAKTYWIQRGQLTDHSFSLVSWDVLGRAVRSYPHTFQMWLSKFASGHSAVGVTMLRWKNGTLPGVLFVLHMTNLSFMSFVAPILLGYKHGGCRWMHFVYG